ncbi:ylmG homolog protein 2, chloroplastic [Andrographis paniculata]|uniref:ylmG homolog protein 2, chloroplastic n=1 Tax=Andrographis paniculata TaxID=175694 RepID=UPI0021E97EBD|nr:ylmG homolog protein 2, chloroplastic [Andrographis paniculata]XP_051129395.1 ylmG homolog protein 2, chloroplastic [Andrographis paniculata]XP_051129396.1 ylmG homolog protein 2, chloroplastic [Andrographis paniculata]
MEESSFSPYQDMPPAAAPPANLLIFPFPSAPFSLIHISPPFLGQPLSSSKRNSDAAATAVRQVHKSFCAALDNLLKMMDALRSQNALLDKVMSFPSYLQDCCQIPGGGSRNLLATSNNKFAAILPGDSVAGVVVGNGIMNFLNIYNTLLIVRIVLTWFPDAPAAVLSPLSTLCDPYLNIFRGIIPPLGGTLDLSPILAFLVLNAFTSAAAALPCELPDPHGQDQAAIIPSPPLTSSQKKWITRFALSRDSATKKPRSTASL